MKLNNKYRIVYDNENTILEFFEERTKTSGDKHEFVERYYYPNLKTALTGFLNKCTWDLETAKEVLCKLKKLESLIKSIK